MTKDEIDRAAKLFADAATKYQFRDLTPAEATDPAQGAAYVRALIAHVHQRDFAMAEELRLGKLQADWTPTEVEAFERRLWAMRSAHELAPGVHTFEGVDFGDGFPVTEACLADLAGDCLQTLVTMRREDATKALPILAVVLLTTGEARLVLPSSDDRIAVLKALARTQPVFGFALTFDAWMHQITVGIRATKRDAILQHRITRDVRLITRRPYAVHGARVVFDDPPPPDLDGRAEGPDLDDPYAAIFVLPSVRSEAPQ